MGERTDAKLARARELMEAFDRIPHDQRSGHDRIGFVADALAISRTAAANLMRKAAMQWQLGSS